MRWSHAREHENFRALCRLPPLLGERAGVRASFSSELILAVRGGFWLEKQCHLVNSAAAVLATILELTVCVVSGLTLLNGCGTFTNSQHGQNKRVGIPQLAV